MRTRSAKLLLAISLGLSLVWAQPAASGSERCATFVKAALSKTKTRPDPVDLAELASDNIAEEIISASGLSRSKADLHSDKMFHLVIQEVLIETLEAFSGEDVYFVARDGEWLYDGMMTLLEQHPEASKLKKKFRLINLSRPIAVYGSSAKQLVGFLEANDIDIEKIIKGKSRIAMIDTGERGSIFISTLKKIVEDYGSKHNWTLEKLQNLLFGFEVRLLHALYKDNREKILKGFSSGSNLDVYQINSALGGLGFVELLSDKRSKLGVPTSHGGLHNWLVTAFERRYHWLGRASRLSEDGRRVVEFEDIDKGREEAFLSQALIVDYFSRKSVYGPLRPFVKGAISRLSSKD